MGTTARTKVALLTDAGMLVTRRIPTAYVRAQEVRGGVGIVTYQVNGGDAFWIGADALEYDGEALPIGGTAERLADIRVRTFLGACLVEALVAAGYPAGSYTLFLGIAIPNEEMVLDLAKNSMGVNEETRRALKEHLRGTVFAIERTDERGRRALWQVTIGQMVPQAQSIGTFLCWSRRPDGQVLTDVDALTVLDIGGGDLQRTDISTRPYRMLTQRLGPGTISIARALSDRFPRLRLNTVQAQHALITRTLRISGRPQDIGPVVDEVVAANQDILARILPTLQQQSRFVLITGGGSILLRRQLLERAAATGKRAGDDYEVIDHGLSAMMNAVGALFAVLFTAYGRR